MKPFIRTIFIWLLSLSLTGMPVIALSQSATDIKQFEKVIAVQDSNAQVSDSRMSNVIALDVIASDIMASGAMTLEAMTSDAMTSKAELDKPCHKETLQVDQKAETSSSTDGCCCDTDCQCQYDMACQSVGHFSASAILQSTLFISSPLNSQLVIETTVLYCNCDTDSEIIPPIV